MPPCPICKVDISGRDVSDKTRLKPYRVCPHCTARFTVDSPTKVRQALALVIAVSSLGLTIGWCFLDQSWLVPAVTSYIVLVAFIAWSNGRVRYVVYR